MIFPGTPGTKSYAVNFATDSTAVCTYGDGVGVSAPIVFAEEDGNVTPLDGMAVAGGLPVALLPAWGSGQLPLLTPREPQSPAATTETPQRPARTTTERQPLPAGPARQPGSATTSAARPPASDTSSPRTPERRATPTTTDLPSSPRTTPTPLTTPTAATTPTGTPATPSTTTPGQTPSSTTPETPRTPTTADTTPRTTAETPPPRTPETPPTTTAETPPPITTPETPPSTTTTETPTDTLIVKANRKALEGMAIAQETAGQNVQTAKLLPKKPDHPRPGETKTARDTGFDKPPVQCTTGASGECRAAIPQDDREVYNLPVLVGRPKQTYRMDVDIRQASGGVIETTGQRTKPDLTGTPRGVDVSGSDFKIGNRTFTRVQSYVDEGAIFSLQAKFARGANFELDHCRDKEFRCHDLQPSPSGMQPIAFSATNNDLPSAIVKLNEFNQRGRAKP
jgi:hypothetical protein